MPDDDDCSTPDPHSLRVRPAVSGIYGIFRSDNESGDDGGKIVGSGLFVRMRDRPCILTAAHVAQEKDVLTVNRDRRYLGLAHSTANGSAPAFITSQYLCVGPPE